MKNSLRIFKGTSYEPIDADPSSPESGDLFYASSAHATKNEGFYQYDGAGWKALTQTASEVVNTPSGNLAATDVQSALVELQGDIDTLSSAPADVTKANVELDNLGTTAVNANINPAVASTDTINLGLVGQRWNNVRSQQSFINNMFITTGTSTNKGILTFSSDSVELNANAAATNVKLLSTGDVILAPTGDINASTNLIKNVVDPIDPQDAATRQFVLDNAGSGGGGGTSITKLQVAHGFSVLDSIYHNGTIWVKAQSDDGATLAQYVVTEKADDDNFTAFQFGEVTVTAHGKTVGQYYFNSNTVLGGSTPTEPTTGFSSPIFYVEDANTIIVNVYRPHGVDVIAATIDSLEDVTAPTPSNGDILIYNSATSDWENGAQQPNPNILINGDMRVNQRGTLPDTLQLNNGYKVDRWKINTGTATAAISIETASQPAALSGSKSLKLINNSGTLNTSISTFQFIEDYKLYEGKTLTVSAWVNSNTSNARFRYEWSGSGLQGSSVTHSGTPGWEYLSFTFTAPSNLSSYLFIGPSIIGATGSVNIANGEYIEFTGVKLELGNTATEFVADSYGDSLRKCQRYYEKGKVRSDHYANSGTNISTHVFYNVPKMSTTPSPTVTNVSANNMNTTVNVIEKTNSGFVVYHNQTVTTGGNFIDDWEMKDDL